jgi:translation elongation factor EF-4
LIGWDWIGLIGKENIEEHINIDGLTYVEVSAKTGDQIETALAKLASCK